MAYVVGAPMLPAIQDALKNPEKWNSEWEKLTKQLEFLSPAEWVLSVAAQLEMGSADGMDRSLVAFQTLVVSLRDLQAWITRDALTYFARHDLEAKWMNADAVSRRKHILIGLSRACSIAKNLHDARVHCGKEFRLSYLGGDGAVVLGLNTLYIPDPAWDAFADTQKRSNPSEKHKFALAHVLLLRTKLICHFVQFTIKSFLGVPLPEITVMKTRRNKKYGDPQQDSFRDIHMAALKQALGSDNAKAKVKDDKAAWKEHQSKRREHCSYPSCSSFNDQTEKYPRCKECWVKMQREVLYCSVECQKADWKPNHKAICGKPLDFEAVTKTIPAPRSVPAGQVGPPVQGYKRSPVLLYHIDLLNQGHNLKYDYIISASLDDPVCLDFPDPEAQSLFRKCREKAMTTGDRQSVATMAHFLCWMTMDDKHIHARGATPNVIVGQLKKEYLFDELRTAVLEMQQRQNSDPFRRPCAFHGITNPQPHV
ncbi:hypothetical protein B0H10DRAFT_2089845 [Mycena sp. CBHHK59/15]|nr:hypothetical protein B0H10DRAFT_2089845 [Mycena sp. CBHHK59/15]